MLNKNQNNFFKLEIFLFEEKKNALRQYKEGRKKDTYNFDRSK